MDPVRDQERPSPLRLTAYAVEQVLLVIPLAIVLVVVLAGGVLAVVWAGIALVLLGMPLLRGLANRQRRVTSAVLGTPVPPTYLPFPEGGPLVRFRSILGDATTWRDLVWALWAITLGPVLSLIVVVLLVGVVTGYLWWYGARPVLAIRSRVDRSLLTYGSTEVLERRVEALTRSRAAAVDHSAAELRRLERDLHDGTQARLVAVTITLGLADAQFETDPAAARRTVSEARDAVHAAVADLRSVVRGIHPPVLADRGLDGALRALALDVGAEVEGTLAGRPPTPVESAVYFAVAECLANARKHADASALWVDLAHRDHALHVVVGDDGRGGADPDAGTGMRGVMRRLAAFDGTMSLSSPAGGPTIVTLEVPCELDSSSPRTTPSSAPA
jgi:signal transduction histidine kinase